MQERTDWSEINKVLSEKQNQSKKQPTKFPYPEKLSSKVKSK